MSAFAPSDPTLPRPPPPVPPSSSATVSFLPSTAPPGAARPSRASQKAPQQRSAVSLALPRCPPSGTNAVASTSSTPFLPPAPFQREYAPVEEEQQGASEEQEEEEPDERHDGLPDIPSSPSAQIALLREMDADADAALTANQAYQAELLSVMERLDRAKKRTVELGALIETIHAEMTGQKEMRFAGEGVMEPTLPWFKWQYGKDLPPNPDGEARDRYLATIRSIPWTAAERLQLKQEVVAQNHRLLAMEAQHRGEDLHEAIMSRDPQWFVESTYDLDWDRIALVVDRRTATECRIQWLQKDHPSLDLSSKWKPDEREKLYEIVEQHGESDWSAISKELGTGRPPAECLKMWRRRPSQRKNAANPLANVWEKEDDERLAEGVRLYGENWQEVARHTGYTSAQCINRWTRALRPNIKRGKWTAQEDVELVAALKFFGWYPEMDENGIPVEIAEEGKDGIGKKAKRDRKIKWKEVSLRVKGRTDAQCRERWVNLLDPRLLDKNVWAEEEDAMLVRMRDEENLTWADIARDGFHMRRTDNDCLRRYTDLKGRLDPNYVPRRIGRPPNSLRKGGRPRKSAAKRKREERDRKKLEEELDRAMEEEGDIVGREEDGGTYGTAAASKVKGKGKKQAVGKGKARTTKRSKSAQLEEQAVVGQEEEEGGGMDIDQDEGDDASPPPPPTKTRKKAPPKASTKAKVTGKGKGNQVVDVDPVQEDEGAAPPSSSAASTSTSTRTKRAPPRRPRTEVVVELPVKSTPDKGKKRARE
ncbi:hypothetical protein JCM8547_001941 [Rhodosporidiobolus lusitaniae]